MKSKYDVIAECKNGAIQVVHNTGYPMKSSYTSKIEFNEDLKKTSANGIVVESING
jgi:predicted Fe-Mo cluster-binding NifX family protein